MRYFLRAAILASAISIPLCARAATPPDPLLTEATDLAGYAMFASSGAPGMVLVVVRGPEQVVLGFGETAKGNHRTPNGQTLFRLNSITKVFAGQVLAAEEAAGKLSMIAPLQRYAQSGTVPAGPSGRPITLLDLATHSAALPREIGEAPPNMPPRTWPTQADRWKWLATYKLPWDPGTVTSYSNVGFDFLADALGTAGGKPYPQLLHDLITGPLDMPDTVFAPTAGQCAQLMLGTGLGGAGPCVDTSASDGSGGLYSTGDDMARWLHDLLNIKDPTNILDQAVYRERQTMPAAIGFDEASPMNGLGLGWVITAAHGPMPALLDKSGGGVGFMSYVVFAPGTGVGVFVVVNKADFAMFEGIAHGANALVATLTTR